jgi:tetratricopeptide (TPR) repeat protein
LISLNSSNTTGFYLLGCIYEKKGDLEKSIESFNKAIEADQNNVNALFSRGAVYNMLGNYQKAIDDYYLALEMDSKRKTIYRNLGRVLGLNNEAGETDRTLSPDQSHLAPFNNSKQLDNLNIDGDINHYVYKHLSDLAIRNTSLSLENSKLKLSNGNTNKIASPLSNTPTKLINNIGMTNEPNYNFSNKHEFGHGPSTNKENINEYNNSKSSNALSSFNRSNIPRSEMMSKGSSFNQISSPTAQTGLPSHYNDHMSKDVSDHLDYNNDTLNNYPSHHKNNSNINITKVEINDNFTKKFDKNEGSGKLVMRTEGSPEIKKDKKKNY